MVEVRDSDHCINSTSEINLTLKIKFVRLRRLLSNLSETGSERAGAAEVSLSQGYSDLTLDRRIYKLELLNIQTRQRYSQL